MNGSRSTYVAATHAPCELRFPHCLNQRKDAETLRIRHIKAVDFNQPFISR